MQVRAHLLLKPVSASASMTAVSASRGGSIAGCVRKCGRGRLAEVQPSLWENHPVGDGL